MNSKTEQIDLIDAAPPIGISFSLPTQTDGRETRQNPIMLKNLLAAGRTQLESREVKGPDAAQVSHANRFKITLASVAGYPASPDALDAKSDIKENVQLHRHGRPNTGAHGMRDCASNWRCAMARLPSLSPKSVWPQAA